MSELWMVLCKEWCLDKTKYEECGANALQKFDACERKTKNVLACFREADKAFSLCRGNGLNYCCSIDRDN